MSRLFPMVFLAALLTAACSDPTVSEPATATPEPENQSQSETNENPNSPAQLAQRREQEFLQRHRTCSSAQFQQHLGEYLTEFDTGQIDTSYRIVRDDMPTTLEIQPQRLTIVLDASGRIAEFYCG